MSQPSVLAKTFGSGASSGLPAAAPVLAQSTRVAICSLLKPQKNTFR